MTGRETQEYGRRQFTVPLATRGDHSYARTTLSRLANHLGYFLPAHRSRGLVIIFSGRPMVDARFLSKLRRLLSKTNEQDRKIILLMAQKMALR